MLGVYEKLEERAETKVREGVGLEDQGTHRRQTVGRSWEVVLGWRVGQAWCEASAKM